MLNEQPPVERLLGEALYQSSSLILLKLMRYQRSIARTSPAEVQARIFEETNEEFGSSI